MGVGFCFGIKMRDPIFFLQYRHPLVVRGHQDTCVLECRPDHVLDAGSLGRLSNVLSLDLFLLAGEVLPEVRHGVYAVGTSERLLQTLDIIEISLDHFGALRG